MKALLRRNFHRLIDSYMNHRATNIELQRQLLASASTARFIERRAAAAACIQGREEILRHAVDLARNTPGLICEFGVYRGASINLLARLLPDRPVFGFDSFDGLPQHWRNGYGQGAFDVSGSLPVVPGNVQLIKGWFCDTLGGFLEQHPDPVALVHVDCDLYSSTRTVLEGLAERIRPGTVLLFDEYFNYPGWQQHEHKAFAEFARSGRHRFEYVAYNASSQQVVVRCCE